MLILGDRQCDKTKLFISIFRMRCALKRARWFFVGSVSSLLGAGVLGHSLGSLRDGVFGELTGEEQTDGGLDFPGGDC